MQNAWGSIDYDNLDWKKISHIIEVIRKNAKTLDIKEIDTPIMETSELLHNKYTLNNDNNISDDGIFTLNNRVGLRYDLTVPLMRYVATNNIVHIRRLQIGKVFRKDISQINKRRYREFYQADVDIVGEYDDPILPEIEIFWLINKVLQDLNIKNYHIKYNYRKNIYSILDLCNIPNNIQRKVCSIIDKLDKFDWNIISNLLKEVISLNQISELRTLLNKNYLDPSLAEHNTIINDNCLNLVRESSLVRGLDYYTGIIYEVVVPNSPIKTIIAGGRYDKFIHEPSKKGKKYIPAIGVSFGISRMVFFIDYLHFNQSNKKILIISPDIIIKAKLLKYFRNLGYCTTYYKKNVSNIKQIKFALQYQYQYIVIYGEDGDKVKIKNLTNDNKDKLYSLANLMNLPTSIIFE